MIFKQKNVLVYGLSASGEWASKLLLKKKANVYLYDDDIELLRSKNIKYCYVMEQLNEELVSQFDYIIVSPAISSDNHYLQTARENKIKIMSEVEFAANFCKNIVAITGTNGKTTTVQLVTKFLLEKKSAIACGNIGYTLSQAVLEKKNAIKVCEVSSFMLENCDTFSPRIATVLNISPDHLIRHKTMEEYTRLKLSIFKNLTVKDYAVVNSDDKLHINQNCKILTYSLKRNADVYIKNGYIFLHDKMIVAIKDLKLKGDHNLCNIMCAICYAYVYKIPIKNIQKVLIEFKADDFRIQDICEINGIKFVNDSKSTNIASTIASVKTIKRPIMLMLGGSNKNLDYSMMFAELSTRVKKIFVYGEIASDLLQVNKGKFECYKCETMEQAFSEAVKNAKKGDVVLLSPATASYDQYISYIERGKKFNDLVKAYALENK